MKVSELINTLLENNKPDDEILVLWWDKQTFDFADDDELVLTDDAWLKVSNIFDTWDNAGTELTQWIAETVTECAEIKEVTQ